MKKHQKLCVAVIFGGRTGEHEVSVKSGRSVLAGLDLDHYHVVPIGITREGVWLGPEASRKALEGDSVCLSESGADGQLSLRPGGGGLVQPDASKPPIDVVFPAIHGTYGEDGTLQGLLEMADLPYVGCGVAGSAVGMDKVLMKDIWAAHQLPQPAWATVYRNEIERDLEGVLRRLHEHPGLPCFVKPANLGSSVGISKANRPEELRLALQTAASYDRKVLVEASVEQSREFNVGVLGNDDLEVSVAGEIVHTCEWLDYHNKYKKTDTIRVDIPAAIPAQTTEELQRLARKAYRCLDLSGLSRVDFLMNPQGQIFLNEVNTMPGFTPVSLYARLWEATGLSFPRLLDRLIELAQERFRERQRNQVLAEV